MDREAEALLLTVLVERVYWLAEGEVSSPEAADEVVRSEDETWLASEPEAEL
ncbi:hypothetical protein KL934_005437, partial [Ogataea polymorpha]